MKKLLFKATLGLMGMMGTLAIGVVNAGNYVTTVPGLVATGEQDGQIFEYGVLKFDDGSGHIIMLLDRNLGATMTGAGADANTGSYGFKYQWGNNYGFKHDCWTNGCKDDVVKSSTGTKITWNPNYDNSNFSGRIFITDKSTNPGDYWSDSVANSGNHMNLWGGGNDESPTNYYGLLGEREQSMKYRQGPCPDGRHVPANREWEMLVAYWHNIEKGSTGFRVNSFETGDGRDFSEDFYIPFAGYRYFSSATLMFRGSRGILWGSSSEKNHSSIYVLYAENDILTSRYYLHSRISGIPVRCFYNNFNMMIFNTNGGSYIEPEIIYGNYTGTVKPSNPTRRGYIFDGRFLDKQTYQNEYDSFGSQLTSDLNLYAKWALLEYNINYELNGGINDKNNVGKYAINTPQTILKDATKDGYKFLGWYSDENFTTEVTVIGGGNIGDITLYAKWGCEDGYIENESGTACEKIRVDFDANGGKFSDNTDMHSIIKSKQVLGEKTGVLHTANLDDNDNYTNEFNGQTINGYTTYLSTYTSGGITTYPISSPSIVYFEEENVEKFDVSIKYGGSPYCTPGYIIVWTGDHRQFDQNYNPGNTGLAVLYIADFSNFGENREKSVEIEGDSFTIYQNSGCPSYGFFANISRTGILDLIYEENAFDNIPEPTREGHSFKGWYLTDGTKFNTGNVSTGEIIKVYAKWECADGYENKGGECVKKSSGSSGGGGRSSRTSDKDKDTTNNLSVTDVIAPLESGAQGDSNDGSPLSRGDTASAERGSTQNYTQEFQEAYEFAKEKGITTMPTINEANMNGKLTRIAMAKMLSYYAINVLGQKPDETRNNKFNDITDKLDAQYDSGVTLAFQLGIMGINMPDNKFRPNDEVTRAEFSTALSRMLYSTPDGKPYYTTHLEKLKEEGILKNDDYKMKELRGYVMIMLMRSAK